MSSEHLASAQTELKGDLGASWNILDGASANYTDLGIARRFGDAAAAYSLRDIGAMNTEVVKVRRDVDGQGSDPEENFSAKQVDSGALEDWVNGKLESTLPADVAPAAAAYSLRKVSEGKLVYTGDFSSDANTISANTSAITVTGNNDGISDGSTSKDNVLKVENDQTGVPQLSTSNSNYESSTSGVVEFEYFVPSTHPIVGNFWHLGTNQTSSGEEVAYTSSGVKIVGGAWTTAKLFYGSLYGGVDKGTTSSDGGRRLLTILDQRIADGVAVSVNAEDGDVYYISSLTIKTYDAVPATIRRSSDGVEVNVHFDSDNKVSNSSLVTNVAEFTSPFTQVTTDATTLGDFINGTDAFVVIWKDQAGLNDASQITAANQPQIASSGALLADGIDFDGTNDRLVSSSGISVTTSTDISFNIVGESDDITSTQTILSQKSGTGQGRSWTDIISSNFRSSIGGSAKTFGSVSSNGTQFLFSYILDESANTADAFKNAAQSGSQQTVNNAEAADGAIVIGCNNGESGQFLNGHLKEVIIYTSDQTDNRFKIESNINNHYGLYNDANDITQTTWQNDGTEGTFTSTSLDGFSYVNSSSTAFIGVTLKETLALNDSVFVSFNATGVTHPDSSDQSPQIRLRDGVGSGSSGTSAINQVTNGFNAYTLTYAGGANGQHIVFSEGDTAGGTVTISDFKVSRIARNGFVETWYDQSGSGNDATQTTASDQPSIVQNGGICKSNGSPSVFFTGDTRDDELDFTDLTLTDATIFTVVNIDNSADQQIILGGSQSTATGTMIPMMDNGSGTTQVYKNSTVGGAEQGSSQFKNGSQITLSDRDDAFDNLAVNSQILFTMVDVDVAEAKVLDGISRPPSDALSFHLQGQMNELIIYNTDLSSDRGTIESEIANHYNITLS